MSATIHVGDCGEAMRAMPAESVQCCVTSPPYWGLRDYGAEGQIGLEATPEEYVERMVGVFREVRRVLRDDGTVWLNLGDSYAGSGPSGASYQSATTKAREGKANDGAFRISKTLGERGLTYAEKKPTPPPGLKPKDLVGIPWRVAFALQADGWYLRSDIIWSKPNPMPESVTDRPTKAHEYVFMLSKSARYRFDADAVKEPHARLWDESNRGSWRHGKGDAARVAERGSAGSHSGPYPPPAPAGRNIRTVWPIASQPFPGAHFAVMPPKIVEPCVKAGCPVGGTVLDPFAGAGTVGLVAARLGRSFLGVELNPEYAEIARRRILEDAPLFNSVTVLE